MQFRGAKTWEQLELKKAQAARFTRNILKDEEKANRIESESVDEYAQRKKIRIKNPDRRENMARIQELQDAIVEATAELDQADGSRTEMTQAFDTARQILADAYGDQFETAVSEYLTNENDLDDDGLDDETGEEIDEE